jgi:hypothetical protein
MLTTTFRKRDLKPYWSKQHGAYITLFTSWLIAIIASGRFLPLQIIILLFILSGLNFSELFSEKFKRKSSLPSRKLFWLYLYAFVTFITGIIIVLNHSGIINSLPVFGFGLALFSFLSYKRFQKSILSEWIIFAIFSIAGMIAYIPQDDIEQKVYFEILFLMSAYFGITIFTIKARLKKVVNIYSLIYALLTTVSLVLMFGWNLLVVLVSNLIILKSLQVILFKSQYEKLKLQTIGIIETTFYLIFILIFIFIYSL